MKLDEEVKSLSIDWAEKVFNNIEKAFHDPEVKVEGASKKIYDELKAWELLDKIPMDCEKEHTNDDCYTMYIYMIAMQRYRQLIWEKANPKKSKWEVVTGQKLKET